MISRAKRSFWRYFDTLDPRMKRIAEEAYERFRRDPSHPSLHFKKLSGRGDVWTVRINDDFRAACIRRGDTAVWFWIGPHKEFDKLFG